MSLFLIELKRDFQKKKAYLRYLKITTKFCQPCKCKNIVVH